MNFSDFVRVLTSAIAENLEGWPNHHHALRNKVIDAVHKESAETIICALESYYLPHGGQDELWVKLTPQGGSVSRIRTLYRGGQINLEHLLTVQEAANDLSQLQELGVWSLPPYKLPVRDGWPCAVAIAGEGRVHSIQMHCPEGQHLRLVEYLSGLQPLPDETNI